MLPWWKKYPERLDYELNALEEQGIRYEINEAAREQGKIVLSIWPIVDDNQVPLTVKFPDSYPFFRFEVEAPTLSLGHHQNPVQKNLCLLGRHTSNWNPSDTVASLISSQLGSVIKSGTTDDRSAVAGLEEHQAEPLSNYCSYLPGSIILVDGSWNIPSQIQTGWLEVGIDLRYDVKKPLRGAVLSVQDNKRKTIVGAPKKWNQHYPKKLKGRWVRINGDLPAYDSVGLEEYIRNEIPSMANYNWQQVTGGKVSVTGLLFMEEVRYAAPKVPSWLFLIHGHKGKFIKKNKIGFPINIMSYLSRASRAGIIDYFARIPELTSLNNKIVAVIGLGCIGSTSAIEFAKAGVGELRLMDHDMVSPGNSCRWPLGNPFFGLAKSASLKHHIESNFLNTNVTAEVFRLGAPHLAGKEFKTVTNYLDGVDLVFDATAEPGVQYFLADCCRERGIPFIMVESRHGGWGGLVARVRPFTGSGCYVCLKKAQYDGSLPSPPQLGEETFIQPAGCADPTFTAAGFDTSEVALAGVRMAVSTLCEGENNNSYPEIKHDIGILRLRDEQGNAIFPKWDKYKLEITSECPCTKAKG